MGYRSDVRSVIYGPPDKMAAFVFAMRLDQRFKQIFEHFAENLTTKTYRLNAKDGPITVLELDGQGWKWYPSYEEVALWHDFLHEVDKDDTWDGLEYEFIRVGEEADDVQRESSDNPEFLLSLSRSIEIDLDTSQMMEGFPNETDNVTAGQEQAAPSTGVLCDADHVDADHRVGGSADGGDGHGQDPLQPDVDG